MGGARVILIVPSLVLGGAERSLVKTVAAIKDHTERIEVIVLADVHETVVAQLPPGIGLHVLKGKTSANPYLWFRVRRLLVKFKPTVVVGWSLYANLVAIVTTRFLNIRQVIVSERNYIPELLSRKHQSLVRRRLNLFLLRLLYRRAGVVTANSADNVRFLKKFIGPGPRYELLPNLIDVDLVTDYAKVRPQVPLPDTEGPRVLAIGRFEQQKGFDILLEAFAIVHRRYPWRLVLVGNGPERDRLYVLAKSLGIENAVTWIDMVGNPFPYYRWADLVVLPSRFEGFPNVALEAMACGRALLSSDCRTGPRELTCNGRFGVLLEPENAASLAAALEQWGRNISACAAMGASAQAHVRATYEFGSNKKVYAKVLCLTP